MIALPLLVIIIAVVVWYIGTIVFGNKIGSLANKLQKKFKDGLEEEEIE